MMTMRTDIRRLTEQYEVADYPDGSTPETRVTSRGRQAVLIFHPDLAGDRHRSIVVATGDRERLHELLRVARKIEERAETCEEVYERLVRESEAK
jgi:hypothetical protein